jgi:hypothetical protein
MVDDTGGGGAFVSATAGGIPVPGVVVGRAGVMLIGSPVLAVVFSADV